MVLQLYGDPQISMTKHACSGYRVCLDRPWIQLNATVSVFFLDGSSDVRVCLYMIQLSREEGLDPINHVNPTHDFSCLSQGRTRHSIDI
jgi:hypothetical protein